MGSIVRMPWGADSALLDAALYRAVTSAIAPVSWVARADAADSMSSSSAPSRSDIAKALRCIAA